MIRWLLLFFPTVALAQVQPMEMTPAPVDMQMVNHLWDYIKKEIKAPDTLPPPRLVLDWEVPVYARMGFQSPQDGYSQYPLQISVAPRTIDMWPPVMVLYGLGHEMTHYVFLLRENGWDATKKVFVSKVRHHCNLEFMRITMGVADELWKIYHDDTDRAKMYEEVRLSCSNFPKQ